MTDLERRLTERLRRRDAALTKLEDRYRELAKAVGWHVFGDPSDTEDHREIVKLASYLRTKLR